MTEKLASMRTLIFVNNQTQRCRVGKERKVTRKKRIKFQFLPLTAIPRGLRDDFRRPGRPQDVAHQLPRANVSLGATSLSTVHVQCL